VHAHSSSGRASKQHTAPHCTTLQQNATDRNALQRNATHCSIHYTGVCTLVVGAREQVTHCNTLHRSTATHFSTLQHTPHHILYRRVSTQYSTCFVREEVAHRLLFLAVINHPPATAATMMCMLPCDCQGNALGSTAPVGRREAYCVGCAEIYTKPTSTRAHPHTHAHCTRCMCTHTVVTTNRSQAFTDTHTHTYTYTYACTHACTHLHVHIHTHIHIHVHIHIHIHIHVHIHIHTRTHISAGTLCSTRPCLRPFHESTLTCTKTNAQVQTCSHQPTHSHTYTHIGRAVF